MTTPTPLQVLGASLAGAVAGKLVSDLINDLVLGLATALDVDAVGIIVFSTGGDLELLSASSHSMAELEIHETVDDEGPCVESARTGRTVFATGDQIARRWPSTGATVTAAGFHTVMSLPLLWRGKSMGGLNLFWKLPKLPTPLERDMARAFGDAATLVLGQSSGVRVFPGNVVSALNDRVIIQTAKGALAHELGTDLSAAYDELRRRADDEGRPLSETARAFLAGYAHDLPTASFALNADHRS